MFSEGSSASKLIQLLWEAEHVEFGEALDFWRVVGVGRPTHLLLHAEMKLPGIARLEFQIKPLSEHPTRSKLTMTARFRPKGLAGLAYWYSVVPLHHIVFAGMLNGIKNAAEEDVGDSAVLES